MNSRERVIAAVRFQSPDRVPVMHRTLPGAFRVHGQGLADLYTRYPSDVMLSPSTRTPFAFCERETPAGQPGTFTDPWGCLWQQTTDDWQGRVVRCPLADWSSLKDYSWPEPLAGHEGVEEMVAVMAEDHHQHYFLGAAGTLMHQMTFLRGFEATLIDLLEEREEILYVRDRIGEILLRRIEAFTAAGVDGILLNDDWGTQRALYMRPALWRKWFKVTYKMLADAAHAGGALVHYHSDGVIHDILPDLVDIGCDELNPQVWIMDVDALSRQYRGRVCFRADLDRQHVLCEGTPDDVARHVTMTRQAFDTPLGGFIGYGQIGPDTPIANAEAMLRTFCALMPPAANHHTILYVPEE